MVTIGGLVKVLDFGLAKLVQRYDSTGPDITQTVHDQTHAAGFLGTIAYASPEQAQDRRLDARSDIFSVGLVLYEMFAGRHPFMADSAASTLTGILMREPDPLPADIPNDLQEIILLCLKKDPGHRYQNMLDVKVALEGCLAQWNAVPSSSSLGSDCSVAVLPFVNLNHDPDGEFFSDGLTEELIATLSQSKGLRVISRTSTSRFKNTAEDVRQLGRNLAVSAILEGSVRRVGSRWRVAARLIDVVGGYHLWAQQFDRDVTDVLAVQEELAKGIVEALNTKWRAP